MISDDADRCAERPRPQRRRRLLPAANAERRGVVVRGRAPLATELIDVEPQLVIVSGDEAAGDPNVRGLAERAQNVIAISMFHGLAVGWADLVLPGTSYLERDGTYVNLEGRLQRLRRTASPPCPDELAWIAKLAERFGVDLSPHTSMVFDEISARCYGGIAFGDIPEHEPLPDRVASAEPLPNPATAKLADGEGLRLVTYRPLFSGAAVERTPELEFLRPTGEVDLAPDDARARGIAGGDTVTVKSNGTSRELRARIARDLAPGLARIPRDDATGLHDFIEVVK